MTHALTLFVTTGRCGTQWLATNLARTYADVAVVEHEPIGPRYRCRDFFRQPGAVSEMRRDPAIRRHLDDVAAILPTRAYVETGWPVFSAVPAFAERFGEALRLVHLTRHPVPTAISHMVHKTYWGSARVDGYTTLAALDPSCPGAIQSELRERWPVMSPFERTLFWWTEVQLHAEELRERYPAAPFHRVRAEDLFRRETGALEELVAFMGLPRRRALLDALPEPVDRWHHRTGEDFDWTLVRRYPRAVEAARRLGYDVDAVDQEGLERRYSVGRTAS